MGKQRDTGLVLTGGGARGAYQAGVLQGISEITRKWSPVVPFGIISGASAGAINASFVAAAANEFDTAAARLALFWASLHSQTVFRTDLMALGRTGLQWGIDLALGSMTKHKKARSVFDTTPLAKLLTARIPFHKIREHLNNDVIQACEVSALDYVTSQNVSFIMSTAPMPDWVHPRRRSVFSDISTCHVMASSAIPLIFPPIAIEERHYGDGCVRTPAPFSPAIRLGARRLLIVGVRHSRSAAAPASLVTDDLQPTIARILGVVINAMMMDTVEYDIDRLRRLNQVVRDVPMPQRAQMELREIDFLAIQPSEDLGEMAAQQFHRLPVPIQYVVRGLGSPREASELASYLLFEPSFCRRITELGRQDAHRRKDEIEAFLFDESATSGSFDQTNLRRVGS